MVTAMLSIESPRSIDEALGLLSASDESVRPIAGGTGLGLLMKHGFFRPTRLVNLRHLASELARVKDTADGGLHIGSMTTLRSLEASHEAHRYAPVLRQALRRLATVRLRNVAQVGGAIAHGDPQMDLPPVLLALDAKIRVSSRRGERWIGAADLFLGYYQTAIANDELVLEIVLPAMSESRGMYRKVTARTVDDWPILGIAAVVRLEDGRPGELRVAVGAVVDHAQRLPEVETALSNFDQSASFIQSTREIAEVAEDAADRLQYSDRLTASAGYQRRLVAVHLRRALEEVLLDPDHRTRGGR
jgi:carbon-monoxide dehydrogenase medium subunit